ncbi:MAG: chorismate mutase [Acidobacteriales bacterium]|nr:chorismate mutase [Terriglobales bacterium]
MNIADWRKRIDKLDRKLVEMLNQRAKAAQAIGRLKRNTEMPIYEPNRERIILQNVRKANRGPFPQADLEKAFRRIIAVMRRLQKTEIQTTHRRGRQVR